jgi:thioredoxin reductase
MRDLCQAREEALVEVAKVHKTVELLVRMRWTRPSRQLQTLVQSHLDVIWNFQIWMLKGQGSSDNLIESEVLQERFGFFPIELETLVSLEEGDLNSCQETRITI